jgi:hypothetical protein
MSEDDKKQERDIEDRIREVAYLMWESAGRLSDMAHEYWVAAEKEVLATWRKAKEQVLPGEKPEKAEEPEAEVTKPAPTKTTRAKPQKPSSAKPEASKRARPAKVAKHAGEKPSKAETASAAPAEAPSARESEAAVGPEAKKERVSLRKRTTRHTREKSEARGRTRRLGKK